jgi:hypothetical protein
MTARGGNAMTNTQTAVREDFCRRVLELPEEGFTQLMQYLDDILPHIISSHIPNAETREAIEELCAGKGKQARNLEEFFEAMHHVVDSDA